MIGVEVRDGWYIVRIDEAVLVMTKADFVQCLRRGKWWRREQALAARLAPDDAAPRQDPPSPAAGRTR